MGTIVKTRAATLAPVLVVNRFRVAEEESGPFRLRLEGALEVLATSPGYRDGAIGRCVDDPALWVLTTTWENVGSYRRALSAYDVKVHVVPVLSAAIDEPSAYEIVEPGAEVNLERSRSLG